MQGSRTSAAVLFWAVLGAGSLFSSGPAAAVDGPVIITQAKALAGNVTPGDHAGFPVSITRPGSYVLGGTLKPVAGKNGIVVSADNVTLDLNGFGLDGGDVAANGIITVGKPRINLTVRNGTIAQFTGGGVYAPILVIGRFQDLRIYHNTGTGIVTGPHAQVSDSVIATNEGNGISCQSYCLVSSNIVSNHLGDGVRIASGSVVGNTIDYNRGLGIDAFQAAGAGNNSLIHNNSPGGVQTRNVYGMQPNACEPACSYVPADPTSAQASSRTGALRGPAPSR